MASLLKTDTLPENFAERKTVGVPIVDRFVGVLHYSVYPSFKKSKNASFHWGEIEEGGELSLYLPTIQIMVLCPLPRFSIYLGDG